MSDLGIRDDFALRLLLIQPGGELNLNVNISASESGKTVSTCVQSSASVGSLKEALSGHVGVPLDRQSMAFDGKLLRDSQTLISRGVRDGSTIWVTVH